MPKEIDIEVVDDSGLLGLVDAAAYRAFVDADWNYQQLLAHFKGEMEKRRILVWECGDGGRPYLVKVRHSFTTEGGFREIVGSISASSETLLLSSYDALTMAAQFEDEPLPSKHEVNQLVPVPRGNYRVRIVQMYDPRSPVELSVGKPHFLVELELGEAEPLGAVAWLSA